MIVLIATVYEFYWLSFHGTLILESRADQFVYDISDPNQNRSLSNSIGNFFSIWSAIDNTKRLFTISNPSRLMLFDTFRLIIVLLIGLTNLFYHIPLTEILHNISLSVPYELFTSNKYFFIRVPTFLNDGLLIIGGALLVRSIFKHIVHRNDSTSYLIYFIRRWIRLTFPLFGSIVFFFLLPSTGYGPLWFRLIELLMPSCHSSTILLSSFLHFSNWNFVRTNYSNDEAFVVVNPIDYKAI